MGKWPIFLLVSGALVLGACAQPGTDTAQAPKPAGDPAPDPSDDAPEPAAKPSKKEKPEPTKIENPAPDFTVETFDGRTFRLSEQRGTPVVLNFWESW